VWLVKQHDDGWAQEFLRDARTVWYGRELTAIWSTIDALPLKNPQGLKPVISHKVRTPYGWRVMVTLPPGISAREFEGFREHFEEQAGGSIEIIPHGRNLELRLSLHALPSSLIYEPQAWEGHMPLPIGQTPAGFLSVDLADIPHVLIAGLPGGGKSNMIHCWVNALLRAGVALCIIDLKHLEYAYVRGRALLATDEETALTFLVRLNRVLDNRLRTLERSRCVNLKGYRGGGIPWGALIIDELAELDDDGMDLLNRILRLSRAVGISCICATQRPSHTLSRKFTDSRSLFGARLCFRVEERAHSEMVLGNDSAARLPVIPGRGIWSWQRQTPVQTPYLDVDRAAKLLEVMDGGHEGFEQERPRLPAR
jgi:S-DNA-T family DNA segregation ATPase FtsK/SpoIIIE